MLSALLGEEPASLRLHDRDQIDSLNEIFVVRIFFRREGCVIRLPAQLADVRLRCGVGPQLQQSCSHLRGKRLSERVQQAIQIARGGHKRTISVQ